MILTNFHKSDKIDASKGIKFMNGKSLKLFLCASACAVSTISAFVGATFSLDKMKSHDEMMFKALFEIAYENGFENESENSVTNPTKNISEECRLSKNQIENMDKYMQSDLVSASASKEYFDTKESIESEYNKNLYGAVVGFPQEFSSQFLPLFPQTMQSKRGKKKKIKRVPRMLKEDLFEKTVKTTNLWFFH